MTDMWATCTRNEQQEVFASNYSARGLVTQRMGSRFVSKSKLSDWELTRASRIIPTLLKSDEHVRLAMEDGTCILFACARTRNDSRSVLLRKELILVSKVNPKKVVYPTESAKIAFSRNVSGIFPARENPSSKCFSMWES